MTTRIATLTSRELISILKKRGFVLDRQSGTHAVFIHPDGRRTTVPIHGKRDLGEGLLRQIMRDVKLSVEDLLNP